MRLIHEEKEVNVPIFQGMDIFMKAGERQMILTSLLAFLVPQAALDSLTQARTIGWLGITK